MSRVCRACRLFQRLRGHGLCCGGLLRLQGIHGGLRGGLRLLRPLEGSLCLLHAGAQNGAACFQCIQRSLCFGSLGVGQGRTLPVDLLFQCVGLCGLRGGRAVCLGCRLFQCRALAGPRLPVGLQCGAAGAVGCGPAQGCGAFGLCRVQCGGLLGKHGAHSLEGQLHRAVGRGEPFGQKVLGIPAQRAAGFLCGSIGALCGGAGILGKGICGLGLLLGGVYLCLRGGGAGQLGLGRVMGAAAHRAGSTLGQALGQQPGLCVQKCPVQSIPAGMSLRLGFGGGAVGLLCAVGLLGQLLAGGQPLGQGGKRCAALGQLLFLRFQRQPAGGSVGQSVQLLFIGSKLCSQLFQQGALLRGLRPGQLRGVPGSTLLAAESFQLVIGGKGGFGLCGLPGQQVQLCGIACMTGALGPGGFQYGLCGGKVGLLCSQLLCQLPGLLCRTQLLLHGVQLRFGVLQGGSGAFLCGPLAGQQRVQQSKCGVRLSLGAQRGKSCGVRVIGGVLDAGEQAVQPGVLGGALLAEGSAFGLQALLQAGVALGAEQLAEDAAALLGGGVEQPGELSLCDHGDLAELAVIQPDDLHDGGGHVLGSGHRRAGRRER